MGLGIPLGIHFMTIHRTATCSWSLQPSSAAELVDSLRRTGLQAVQLALSPVVGDPEQWDEVFDRLDGEGIEIISEQFIHCLEPQNQPT